MEETIGREGIAVELVSRVQLRAVFSGLAVAVGCLAVCMGLSWAIGLSTFQPSPIHARGLALGNIVWGAVALWISIFFGGYVAALVGRSPDPRSGVLHGLVVWGSVAGVLGFALLFLFGGLMTSLSRLAAREIVAGIPPIGLQSPAAIARLVQVAGFTVWLYWGGIVGGLVTSVLGGWLGARSESSAPRPIGVRVPVRPTVPHPA